MIALIRAEYAKLNGSLALLFALVVPALTSLLALLAIVTNGQTASWESIIGQFTLTLWIMFIYPMSAATFATLAAQVEYRARAWDNLLALPYARWQMFLAKLVVVQSALVLMTALLFVYTYIMVGAAGLMIDRMPAGDPGVEMAILGSLKLLGAGLLFSVIQTWVALRFGNFVVSLAAGIAGTLVGLAVTITRTTSADWFPWVLPFRAAQDGNIQPILIGMIGGAIAAVLMLIDLSKKTFR